MAVGIATYAQISLSSTLVTLSRIWTKFTTYTDIFLDCAPRGVEVPCPRCKKKVDKKHCSSPTCCWGICVVCSVIFDSNGRTMVWNGATR